MKSWHQTHPQKWKAYMRDYRARRRLGLSGGPKLCACSACAVAYIDGDWVCARCRDIESRLYDGTLREPQRRRGPLEQGLPIYDFPCLPTTNQST